MSKYDAEPFEETTATVFSAKEPAIDSELPVMEMAESYAPRKLTPVKETRVGGGSAFWTGRTLPK